MNDRPDRAANREEMAKRAETSYRRGQIYDEWVMDMADKVGNSETAKYRDGARWNVEVNATGEMQAELHRRLRAAGLVDGVRGDGQV